LFNRTPEWAVRPAGRLLLNNRVHCEGTGFR